MVDLKLIYIAGYGRSGSTLLDVLLSNAEETVGTGELTRIFHVVQDEMTCSCGNLLEDCKRWSPVLNELSEEFTEFSCDRADRTTRARENLIPSLSPYRSSGYDYDRLWSTTLRAVRAQTGSRILVDSSKVSRTTFHRPEALQDLVYDIRIIHLTRHPKAVLWSVKRDFYRTDWNENPVWMFGEQGRKMIGWLLSNRMTDSLRERWADPVLHVRYQDLAKDPQESMRRIGRFCDIDVSAVLHKLENGIPLQTGHGIRGSRMRAKGEIQLRYDDEWETIEDPSTNLLSTLVKPQARQYGYS